MGTSNVTVRVDDELKKQAEELFTDLGLTMTAAMLAFMKQAVREQRIPFELTRNRPNTRLINAFKESERIASGEEKSRVYESAKEMVDDILS